MMLFCIECRKFVEIYFKTEEDKVTVRDVEFTYDRDSLHCACCGEEIYFGKINDVNVDRREKAYEAAIKNGLQK